MSRRNNAQVSLKLDASPKQPSMGTKTGVRERRWCSLSTLRRSNILSFLAGFTVSSFICMLMMTLPTEISVEKHRESDVEAASESRTAHRAAVVVPFRDRFEELSLFVPHLSRFLANKSIAHDIWVVNQIDGLRFNRAALINVGFLSSAHRADYMIMHDVDLLPLNDRLDYSYPPSSGPRHVSAAGLHPEYNYSSFIGGILAIRREHFRRTDGMSNRYWGWGKEDDEFGLRLREADLTVHRADIERFSTGPRFTFRDLHAETRRSRDKKRFAKQKREALRRDQTGLSNVQYRVDAMRTLTFLGQFTCTVIDVTLFCDRLDTHWCTNDYQFYD